MPGCSWVAVVAAASLLLAFPVLPAAAHKAPAGWSYPPSCCNGDRATGDCQVIPAERVRESIDGYIVTLRPGDHRLVTRLQRYRIPYGEEIRSPDGNFHICLYPTQATVFCFFAPPNSA